MLAIIDTSAILGTFSILHIPSERTTAGMIATAAFFAPLIETSPLSLFPPVITNFSKLKHSQKVSGLKNPTLHNI